MDIAEIEEKLFSIGDAKLHGDMCRILSAIYCKVLSIFPTLEAARPRSRSGIQALCSLHVALEKAKNILKNCSEYSKLYLAITGDSILLKFDKAKCALIDSLKRVEDIVPQSICSRIQGILCELEGTAFSLDPLEKQIGDDIIGLLQLGGKFDSCTDNNELESFHQAVTKLGITSSRAALTERRALKKHIERARVEEDKRKESIVAYLLHLMRKYSKLFRSEISDDNDSQGSAPCSPTVQGSIEYEGHGRGGRAFDRQLSKLSSFNFKPDNRRIWQMPLTPEELRCPISLQLMYDPVIISSGQTYERVCIEKWFSDGHTTCPKTQQKLPHLCLTPNYCVKGLVASWCEHNGVPVPDAPPESLDLNYWRLVFSESESTNSRSMESVGSCKLKEDKVIPLHNDVIEEVEGLETESTSVIEEESEINVFESYGDLLRVLDGDEDFREKTKVVEQIRLLLKDDDEARTFLGANGFVEALSRFLELALHEKSVMAQATAAMALFNLAVNNDRNKEMMLGAGVISLLEEMTLNSNSDGPATALYLNLTCLEEAKPTIGSSQAVPFLIQQLQSESDHQIKIDSLHALYNLTTYPPNISYLLAAGIISGLQSLLAVHSDNTPTEKCIAVLINLASSQSGRDEMESNPGLITALASILDIGEPVEQEQAVSCLLILCNGSEKCSQMVLQEGVIPALVSISVNGTARGRDKAQKLLMLFRQQRQRDQAHVETHHQAGASDDSRPQTRTQSRSVKKAERRTETDGMAMSATEAKPYCKSASRKKMGRALSFLWRSKSYSVYQC